MTELRLRPARVDAVVLSNASEGTAGFRLRLGVPGWPGASPGQFVMLSPGALGAAERLDPLLPRPMAVYRSVDGPEPAIEVVARVAGRGTALLAAARPGERVRVVGPLGRAFPLPPAGSRAVLVGGGTGIASLYGLARRAAGSADVRVLLGAQSVSELLGLRDFRALGIALEIATEDGSEGRRGLVTDLLEAQLDGSQEIGVFACGPTPMMRTAAECAARAGRRCWVSLENPMACGFGVCLGCAAPRRDGGFSLVCRDGPVFDSAEISWEALP